MDSYSVEAKRAYKIFPPSPQETGQPLASSWTAEVTELIAAGADIAAVDAGVKSALAHALDRGLERIPEVLRRASYWVIVPVRRRPLAVPPTVKCLWR